MIIKTEDQSVPSLQKEKEYFTNLLKSGIAVVQHNSLKGDVFIDVSIEGIRFQGIVGRFGPYIASKTGHGDCALGVASINFCTHHVISKSEDKRWWVCKYKNQGRIDLSGLSEQGLRALAYEFGLFIVYKNPDTFLLHEANGFYGSAAFTALQVWAQAHPRKIKAMVPNDYLYDWPALAVIGLPQK